MTQAQFHILYREFLLRLVDLELLSAHAQGDSNKLTGQLGSLLIFFSAVVALIAMLLDPGRWPQPARLLLTWGIEHFLVATTMLVVGLFAVLSWDSLFPNRRDVLVLAPLPVRASTLFLSKMAAVGAGLGLTVGALNAVTGVAWPLLLVMPRSHGILDLFVSLELYRAIAAYAITMLASGAFLFGCVLAAQGVAAQLLPRRVFLRAWAFLQMAAFCLFVGTYFLEPSLANPRALADPGNQRALAWLPSYWFFGLFHWLNGSMPNSMAPLARRAGIGLAAAMIGAMAACLLAYLRTLRKIVEEPDILPASRGLSWLPRFGKAIETAVVHFSIRTLLRSRQHRVILSFYLGVAFAIVVLLLKAPPPPQYAVPAGNLWHDVPLLGLSMIVLCLWILGTRVVFALPLELRANWIFRVMPLPGAAQCLAASRRALLVLAVAPVWTASAALFFSIWSWRPAAGHLLVVALLGTILADVCLYSFRKIPFTCSYLPGKSKVHMMFLLYFVLFFLVVSWAAEFEMHSLEDPVRFALMVAVLISAAILVRWRAAVLTSSEEADLLFEEALPPAVLVLGLQRD
jgi:hypothetical protein